MVLISCISWQALSDDGKVGVLVAFFTLLAVMVALFLGVASFKQTQSLFKKQGRMNLLNEIRQWAADIYSFFDPQVFSEMRDLFDRQLLRLHEKRVAPETFEKLSEKELDNLSRLQYTREEITLFILESKSGYARKIAKKLNTRLYKLVDLLIVHLRAHRRLLSRREKIIHDKVLSDKISDRLGQHIGFLRKYAEDVLSEVAKLLCKEVI